MPGGGVETSGGWAPVEPGWGEDWTLWYDPYGQSWAGPYAAQWYGPAEAWEAAGWPAATGAQAQAEEWTWPSEAGQAGVEQGDGVTGYWYGNPGY